jgi:hypothetical protein
METIFEQRRAAALSQSHTLPEVLAHVLRSGVETADGCVVSRAFTAPPFEAIRADVFDRTGYECFVNHWHFVQADAVTALSYAEEFSRQAARLLISVSPASAFRFIVSNTEDEWTVRFHTVRSGESWVSDDLEGYGSEAVMVLDSTELAPR